MPPVVDSLYTASLIAERHRDAARARLFRSLAQAPPPVRRRAPSRLARGLALRLGHGLVRLGTRLEGVGRPVATTDCTAGC